MQYLSKMFVVGIVALVPDALRAQAVGECDWRAAASAIAEPWERTSRTFAKGAIRLAVLDVIEPAAAAFHLLVLSPPYDEVGGRQCRVVSLDAQMGFAGLTLDGAEAGYDPARGLTVRMRATRWFPGDLYGDAVLSVTINQASGVVTAGLE